MSIFRKIYIKLQKKQLGVSTVNSTINPTVIQKPTRAPSHGRVTKVDKVSKIYTGAPVNQTNDLMHSSLKRWTQPSFDGYEKATASKNIKNITQMYTQAIAESSTPPCSPKPGPSKVRKNVAQLYTNNIQLPKPSSPYISPCISADNLSPRKVKGRRIQLQPMIQFI